MPRVAFWPPRQQDDYYRWCPPDWTERALCAEVDPEIFFPEKGGSVRAPKRICAGCEVRAQCLDYALEHEERFGIWGGYTERERRKLGKTVRDAA